MSLSSVMKKFKRETGLSDVFPITHLASPSVFETRTGIAGSVLRISGIPFELADNDVLNHKSFLLHQAISSLDARFMVYVTTHRKKIVCELKGGFKQGFASYLNERYQERFKGRQLYENVLYLTVVLKGDTSTKTDSLITLARKRAGTANRENQIVVLEQAVQQLKAHLASFAPVLLGENDEHIGYSELLEFLSIFTNAGMSIPCQFPVSAPVIAKNIPDTFKAEQKYPQGHIGQHISRYQLYFGDYIQFQGNTSDDVHFAAMLSLKKYPTETASVVLDCLLSADSEFISTHTFSPLARDASLKIINERRGKFINANDKGVSQIGALSRLEDAIASETAFLGFHHHTLMLTASTLEKLEQDILDVTRRYGSIGIAVVRETLGQEAAFFSQIPANFHLIARASLITSQNFVDFCPLHNPVKGFNGDNFLGSAVALLESPSKTPCCFNFHTRGSKTNPTKGHSAFFGGNNSGKTTLVNFLDAQMMRFDSRSFYLDRDKSSKIHILALGGSYIEISPSTHVSMNPLALPDTPKNRAFLKSWLQMLVLRETENVLPAEIAESISGCIDYALEQLSPQYRTLSNVARFLPKDFSRWPEIRKWLKGNGVHADGDFHWIFDNENDALNLDFDRAGFDITWLMDEVISLVSTPVYFYLLHRMRQSLDGRITAFVIAEAWQVFASPFWVKCLFEWMPTIRKKNGFFIFDTQSPKTVTASPASHIILDNLASLIVFPNDQADADTYKKHLNLTEAEFQAVKENTPESRIFLYKQGKEAMLCKLDLASLPDCVRVLSGNTKSVDLLDSIIEDTGSNPDTWLPVFMERSAKL